MAIISRSYGYLFVMVPRTGCTSIADGALVPESEGSYLPPEDLVDDDGNVLVPRKHSTVGDLTGHGVLDVQAAKDLFKFCTVRNPFDSLVSLYTKLRGQYVPLLDDPGAFIHDQPQMIRDIRFVADHTFPEWIEHPYGRHRGDPRPFYGSYIRNVDHIMRFERLQEDFDEVCTHPGRTTDRHPSHQPSARGGRHVPAPLHASGTAHDRGRVRSGSRSVRIQLPTRRRRRSTDLLIHGTTTTYSGTTGYSCPSTRTCWLTQGS